MKGKSITKKLIILFALVFLISSISACNQTDTSTSPESGTDETSGSDQTTAPADGEMEEITFDFFLNASWWFELDWGSTPVCQEIMEKTGVNLEFRTPVDDSGQELTLMMASGEMPDFVVQNLNTPIYFRSLEAGVFEDLMPLMEEYAPEMINRMGDDYWELTKAADGKNYDYKGAMMHPNNIELYIPVGPWNPVIYIREDIRDALGNPKMDTPDSMFDTLMKIKEEYPDVKPFWIGGSMRFDGPAQGGWQTWLYQFGFDKYYENDGKFKATYKDPRFYEGVEWLNKLYNNGLIDRGDFAITHEEFISMRDTGDIAVFIDGINEGYIRPRAGDQDFVYVFSPPFETGSFLQQDNIGWSGWHITTNNKDKQRAIEFMSYSISDEGQKLQSWGIEGKDWVWDESGENPQYTDYFRDLLKNDPDYRIKTGAHFLYFWHLDLYDHFTK